MHDAADAAPLRRLCDAHLRSGGGDAPTAVYVSCNHGHGMHHSEGARCPYVCAWPLCRANFPESVRYAGVLEIPFEQRPPPDVVLR